MRKNFSSVTGLRSNMTLPFIVVLLTVATSTTISAAATKNEELDETIDREYFVRTIIGPELGSDLNSEGRNREVEVTPATAEEKRCQDLMGQFVDDKFVGLEVTYDLHKILEEHGGPPGKVKATWTEKEDAPVGGDREKRPLPDAKENYWLYRYGDTDGKTYVRIEHAVRRFTGTSKAFLEIRGRIYWTPPDFCENLRRASYIVDDRGFSFNVSRDYCWIDGSDNTYTCVPPTQCYNNADGSYSCVAEPSTGQLASLVEK